MLRNYLGLLMCVMMILCLLPSSISQTSFKDVTERYLGDQVFLSSLAVGINDMNGDEVDDLIVLDRGRELKILINRGVEQPMEIIEYGPKVSATAEWSFAMGDLDNDDIPEILTSGVYNSVKVFQFDPMRKSIVRTQRISSGAYGQGSNVVDINMDGFNDYFLCHDEGQSRIFLNDGNGMLTRVDDYIDFSTDPESDMSGNYGSEWVDLDDDGVPELYMVKCSVRASEFTDPRRINQLFKIDREGVYQNIAPDLGLDYGDQSWSGNFFDMDNDGDLDGIVINHHSSHIVFRNDDGVFSELDPGFSLNSFDFQVMSADFDNNGYTDVLITGGEDYILYNMGNEQFVLEEQPFGYYHVHTASVGDLNNDGFLDAYVGYGLPILEPGNRRDALWINERNENNYVKFSLKGVLSNRSAVGAKVKLYSSLGIQQRFIQGGQSYGTVLSDIIHFGMGQVNQIDSIEVIWPGGRKTKHRNLKVNTHYLVEEGECCITEFIRMNREETVFCSDDTVLLSPPDSIKVVFWEDGSGDLERFITEPGLYYGSGVTPSGCLIQFYPEVVINSELEEYHLPYGDSLVICEGDMIQAGEGLAAYNWSNGEITESIVPDEEGWYAVMVYDKCGAEFRDSLFVSFLHSQVEDFQDTVFKDNPAHIFSGGQSGFWYLGAEDVEPYYIGDSLITNPLSVDTSFYLEVVDYPSAIRSHIGPSTVEEDNPYASDMVNAVMRFDALSDCVIRSVDVYTDTPGTRHVLIFDATGTVVFQGEYMMEIGKNQLQLDAPLLKANGYRITTDANVNNSNLGFEGPRLARSSEGVFYPYTDGRLVSINGSENGPNYYYFYNWDVERLGESCMSNRIQVNIIIDFSKSVEETDLNSFITILPNPAMDFIHIQSDIEMKSGMMRIFSLDGIEVISRVNYDPSEKIDVGHLHSGVYLFTMTSEEGVISKPFVVVGH